MSDLTTTRDLILPDLVLADDWDGYTAALPILMGQRAPTLLRLRRDGVSYWQVWSDGESRGAFRDMAALRQRLGELGWRMPREEGMSDDG